MKEKIISLLRNNARMSMDDIAAELKANIDTLINEGGVL